MPTARPSISASIGEMELMSTTPLRAKVPPTPTATPISAISSGSPAATRVPSMRIRTRAGHGDADDLGYAEELGDVLGDFLAGQGGDAGRGDFVGDVLDFLADSGVQAVDGGFELDLRDRGLAVLGDEAHALRRPPAGACPAPACRCRPRVPWCRRRAFPGRRPGRPSAGRAGLRSLPAEVRQRSSAASAAASCALPAASSAAALSSWALPAVACCSPARESAAALSSCAWVANGSTVPWTSGRVLELGQRGGHRVLAGLGELGVVGFEDDPGGAAGGRRAAPS